MWLYRYAEENISWQQISYKDNSELLTLIEGRMGIIELLNEEVMRPKGNDDNFVSKLQVCLFLLLSVSLCLSVSFVRSVTLCLSLIVSHWLSLAPW